MGCLFVCDICGFLSPTDRYFSVAGATYSLHPAIWRELDMARFGHHILALHNPLLRDYVVARHRGDWLGLVLDCCSDVPGYKQSGQ